MSGRKDELVGIETRTNADGTESYRGTAYDPRAQRKVRGEWTSILADARSWRLQSQAKMDLGGTIVQRGITVTTAADMFIDGVRAGMIRNRSGLPYKPSAARQLEQNLRNRIVPEFRAASLRSLRPQHIQEFADRLFLDLSASTVHHTIMSLASVYAWAIPRGLADHNPTRDLRLPKGEESEIRIATKEQAAALVAAARPELRPAVALAFWAGLRLGEILALDWDQIDLLNRKLRVVRGWDHGTREFITTKTKHGKRTVPIIGPLEQVLAAAWDGQGGLVLPSPIRPGCPRDGAGMGRSLAKDWKGMEVFGFHPARHTFASMLIAAGVNAKAIQTVMGHGSIQITFDRYGHLMPGSENEVRDRLETYLGTGVDG